MRVATLILLGVLVVTIPIGHPRAAEGPITGFPGAQTQVQRDLEARFDAGLDPNDLRTWMEHLSSRPHHVGSPFGREVAEFIAERFREWGYETEMETYEVLFPTPRVRRLEMVAPTRFIAALEEPVLSEDRTSDQKDEQLPSYNAYSIDGDVTGELVYVNYGVPADYEELERRGIDVAGKIVIARYGGSWRGIKPKVAAERGAIGCLIYSDPRDDGYARGDVYPDGPYRMAAGAQRGSVADMPLFPGDPLTPNVGATEGAERLDLDDAPTLTKIPVLPLSYADAEPLLAALGGPVAPGNWRGGLPLTYHLGPGPAQVHLEVAFNWDLEPAYNVIARLEGRERADQWVLRGNHHDAWVNGAADPISGMVVLMAEAKAIGALARTGWRPRRTIVFTAWDAEEPGLIGSTEWAEHHADELRERAVAYINTDGNGRGFLNMSGSHTLQRFINEVARDVTDPETGVSVFDRRHARRLANGDTDDLAATGDHRINALGSGSDYTPFLQHLGIASLNLGYGGESGGGSYHSIFDSFDHYTRFIDPTFEYGIALAQTAGRAVLRLAEAELLPWDFTAFATTITRYADEVIALTDDMRDDTERQNRLLRDGRFELAADPTKTYVPPDAEDPVPHLNFAPVRNALVRLAASAKTHDAARRALVAGDDRLSTDQAREVDKILFRTERAMTHPDGLPGRPWFVHQIYAPGFYTGYGVKTLPGVREAIEERAWEEAQRQIARLADTIGQVASEIDRATQVLEPVAP
ncbi:MAG: M28 family peptidase [Gemmatimonadetes bacterium]|nr:M28 family peptidase [Gemmatimonadota bacterium]